MAEDRLLFVGNLEVYQATGKGITLKFSDETLSGESLRTWGLMDRMVGQKVFLCFEGNQAKAEAELRTYSVRNGIRRVVVRLEPAKTSGTVREQLEAQAGLPMSCTFSPLQKTLPLKGDSDAGNNS